MINQTGRHPSELSAARIRVTLGSWALLCTLTNEAHLTNRLIVTAATFWAFSAILTPFREAYLARIIDLRANTTDQYIARTGGVAGLADD